MRNRITHSGAGNLVYEIREIVEVANQLKSLGQPIIWENIGDPVVKGEVIEDWLKDYVAEALEKDITYAYSPTKGLLSTREYIAKERNLEGGIQITADDILFFNGLGDAISKIYKNLHPNVRVIGPNPAYPTHSSAESAHADRPHLTYSLDPNQAWQPNLQELEQKIHDHPEIVGILIINPDNPTGYVYTEAVLKEIVAIAKRNDLFIISDEIYSNLTYNTTYNKLATIIDDVPAIAMRGISKEFPWPGARCGWVEFYNRNQDADFYTYTKSLIDAKMLEVCSTTLPQMVLPSIMSDVRYGELLTRRNKKYSARADIAYDILSTIPEIIVHKPNGAFYMTVVFKEGVLNHHQTLAIINPAINKLILQLTSTFDISLDKRLVYYLLGSTGLCVVPLKSGFNSTYNGLRFTLLEEREDIFKQNVLLLRDAITAYLASN